uniref:SH3 domain-containing protein n=1 Tax=Ciona savignyi TaxID=51511 RepID=H2ZMA3_CIOSA
MIPTVIKVFLSDDPSSVVEVPITPNTTALDVIDCCKEPGETNCHLAELWRGKERFVSLSEKPFTILQQWGSHAQEVRFCLRHFVSNDAHNSAPGNWAAGDAFNHQGVPGTADGGLVGMNKLDMTLSELKEIAQRQQQQIEQQQHTLVGKEQRLRFLKQQMQQHQAAIGENEKLRRLREKAEAQEAKLKKIRALRGKVEQQRYQNSNISSELEAVRSLFEEKQKELVLINKVHDLTLQLDELRKGFQPGNPSHTVADNMDKLKKEMTILYRMNEEQHKRLNDQRLVLKKRNEDANDLDRRIEELTNRLKQKKMMANGYSGDFYNDGFNSQSPNMKMHTIVAAVEPLVQQSDPKLADGSNMNNNFNPNIQPGKGIINRSPNKPIIRRQPDGHFDPTVTKSYTEDDALTSQSKQNRFIRPQSAMAQLFPESPQPSTSESLTAKVRPMFSKNQPNQLSPNTTNSGYYVLNTSENQSPKPTPSAGINIFAYKQPSSPALETNYSQSNITVLPSGNIKYMHTPVGHPPPPYPNNMNDNQAHANGGTSSQDKTIASEKPIRVDIEALRRKFAHAPRPLKKRSSITEPERPQGPNISKCLYDQLYKKADTLFYRPNVDLQRSTPPPAYVDPNFKNKVTEKVDDKSNVAQEGNNEKKEGLFVDFQLNKEVNAGNSRQLETLQEKESNDEDEEPRFKPSTAIATKGILKPLNAVSKGPNRRIRFDPLALLLDASLEGEFDLVKQIIDQVEDPSGANDEGITALHNAVCAGHFELVRFLVHYGCDINASDTDGWTPLHCAASCNNLAMARFLVENGACIFAATLSDGETAADKCEELDEGYTACSEYLYGTQDKLGVVRQGQVYSLYSYSPTNDDELEITDGELIAIIRKEDEHEREWWWGRLGENEGYVPRNLLGMWPRIKNKDYKVQ